MPQPRPFPYLPQPTRGTRIRAAALLALLSAGTTLAGVGSNTANLAVDATQVIRTVDDRVFGINTAIWDGYLDTPASVTLLTAAGTRALRFPGGGSADVYTWSESDTDHFATVAQGIGAKVFITVNYGTGTPQQAAAWVQYANVTKGYGFKYWEVGNENYGTWESDNNVPANDPSEYARRFVQYYNAMKAVDPTIKVGAVTPTTTEGVNSGSYEYPGEAVINPVTKLKDQTWTGILLSSLKAAGVAPDFLICHRYEQNAGQESDAYLLQAADSAQSGWAADASLLRTALNDYLGAAAAGVEICSTENNSVHNDPGKQTTNLVNGLYLADSVGSLLQTEINSLVWWDLRNGPASGGNNSASLYGWRNFNDYGVLATGSGSGALDYPPLNTPFPPYYVAKLLSNFAGGGDTVVKASSSSALLAFYAVERLNGTLTLLVINKDPSNPWTGNVSVAGFLPATSATVYSYGEPQDTAAQTEPPGNPAVDVQQAAMSVPSASFSATFAPYSATVIAIPALTPPSITTPPASQTVNAGSTVVFTAAAPGATSYQWFLDGVLLGDTAGGTSDVISGAAGPQLVITGATQASAGNYTVVAANAAGSSPPSGAAGLQVSSSPNPGFLVNISSRAFVGKGANILIGGFYIGGNTSRTVLVQALGPALAGEEVPGVLQRPALTIFNSSGVALYSNTGWGTSPILLAAAAAAYATPVLQPDSADSEVLLTLPPGGYTAQIAGADGGTGVALCAIYQLP